MSSSISLDTYTHGARPCVLVSSEETEKSLRNRMLWAKLANAEDTADVHRMLGTNRRLVTSLLCSMSSYA